MTGEEFPSGLLHSLGSQVSGRRSGDPGVLKSKFVLPTSRSGTLQQGSRGREGSHDLAHAETPGTSTIGLAAGRSWLPCLTSLRKSQEGIAAGSVAYPARRTGIRVRAVKPASSPSQCCVATKSSKPSASSGPNVSDDPFPLILGLSEDYPVEINSFRKLSPVEPSTSSWVNLDSNSRPSRSGREGISKEVSVQEKLRALEQTVAT